MWVLLLLFICVVLVFIVAYIDKYNLIPLKHSLNIIAGMVIVTSMIVSVISGSNYLPYVVILLYIFAYWLQKENNNRKVRIIGLLITALLFAWSSLMLSDFIFPFAP